MKKIIIGTFGGLIISILIFLPFGLNAFKSYNNSAQNSSQLCDQIRICNECKKEYNCLEKQCFKFGNECRYIEENFRRLFSGEKDANKENFFVNSLCGNRMGEAPACTSGTKEISKFSRLDAIILALRNLSQIHSWLLGIIILFVPMLVGFSIGVVINVRSKIRN